MSRMHLPSHEDRICACDLWPRGSRNVSLPWGHSPWAETKSRAWYRARDRRDRRRRKLRFPLFGESILYRRDAYRDGRGIRR